MNNALVVGCGLTGATIARCLAESGIRVQIWERRNHIAGNLYDYKDEHNILVSQYGPHIFHTNNDAVWKFINRFGNWNPFKLVCGASWDGKYTPTAFNFKTIDVFYPKDKAELLKNKFLDIYPGRKSVTVVEALNCSDADVQEYAQFLFKNDYAPYTAKQWGVSPKEIDPSVLKRVPLRLSYDEAYFSDEYEAMPEGGYTGIIKKMIDHQNISVKLNIEAKDHISIENNSVLIDGIYDRERVVVYTGPLDELLDFKYGSLPYRSLRFEWKYENIESLQEAPVVAYPQAPDYTRITEYKKLPVQETEGTSFAVEYPLPYKAGEREEPYYPVLTDESNRQYEDYRKEVDQIQGLICCGRLADFKYYNMDQAIEVALEKAKELLG